MQSNLLSTKPQPQQRRYVITNACYTFQNTAVDAFSFPFGKNQQLMQYVYIKDDEKILCWNPQGTTTVGAVLGTLPDAMGPMPPDWPTPLIARRMW